jgi:hypothetical protein
MKGHTISSWRYFSQKSTILFLGKPDWVDATIFLYSHTENKDTQLLEKEIEESPIK